MKMDEFVGSIVGTCKWLRRSLSEMLFKDERQDEWQVLANRIRLHETLHQK